MHWRTVKTIMQKDLKEVRQNKGVLLPAVIVPLFFMVLLPAAIILIPTLIPAASDDLLSPEGIPAILELFSPFIGNQFDGLTPHQAWIKLAVGYMLAPLLLMMPLMLSTIIGAESFVGERERKTLEALIYTPASDGELFTGKLLAAVIPAIALGLIAFVLYGVVANLAAWHIMGRVWFPLLNWWPLMLWLSPALATLGMAVTVLISVRVRTFMEAYQASASLVVVVLALVAGQISGILFLSAGVTMLVGAVVWIIDAVLLWFGVRTFARPSLLSRL
jgi:ABC-2 type transport system permease protein